MDTRSRLLKTNITTDNGHLIIRPGDKIGKYTIIQELGKGTFGTVVKVSYKNKIYAAKVINNRKKFLAPSYQEIRVLRRLSNKYIINLIAAHKCSTNQVVMIFPMLSISIHKFTTKFMYRFRIPEIKVILKQITLAVSYIHIQKVIHTDLKPENIMFVNGELDNKGRIKDISLKLIDFGTTVSGTTLNSRLGSTYHYRAPEIVLGLNWSYPVDIWSIAVIMLELYVLDILFPMGTSLMHLGMMQKLFGPIPYKGYGDQTDSSKAFFTNNKLKPFSRNNSVGFVAVFTARSIHTMKLLENIVLERHSKFLDLLKKMFEYDPKKRITAEQILEHPFLTGVVTPKSTIKTFVKKPKILVKKVKNPLTNRLITVGGRLYKELVKKGTIILQT